MRLLALVATAALAACSGSDDSFADARRPRPAEAPAIRIERAPATAAPAEAPSPAGSGLRKIVVAGSLAGCVDGEVGDARFGELHGLAFLGDGSLLAADAGCRTVRRITTDGRVETFAGSGLYGSRNADDPLKATFRRPTALAVLGDGGVLVGDGDLIRAIDPDRRVRTVSRLKPSGEIAGLAAGKGGEIWVADRSRGRIYLLDAEGDLELATRDAGAVLSIVWHPDEGRLWFAEARSLRAFAGDGGLEDVYRAADGDPLGDAIVGMALAPRGRLYLADVNAGPLLLDPGRTLRALVDPPQAAQGVAVGPDGWVYWAERSRIVAFSQEEIDRAF